MRRSVLFTRVFGVVILAIVVTALFTTFIYTYISSSVFTHIKENELLPRARALSSVLSEYDQAAFSAQDRHILRSVLGDSQSGELLLGAYVVVTNAQGAPLLSSSGIPAEYLSLMTQAAQDVARQGELRTRQIAALHRTSAVGVGTPIYKDGVLVGTILLFMPLYEAMVAMGALNGALIMSLLLCLPLVAILVFWVIGRIIRPLKQMRDVAVGMAQGNFEARADASQRGEVGQLAHSLNYLSRELHRTIAALTLEKNRLQQALDGLQEGIVAVDRSGMITHHNPAVKKIFSLLPPCETDDERLGLINDPRVWQDFDQVLQQKTEITRMLTLDERVVQLRISPLTDEDSRIAGAVGSFSDVTQAERLERTRRDYVANVSHEMRTPLTAMRALLEPLSEGMVTGEEARNRYYSIMLRETMRLSRLIDDLMELSRLQSGKLAMKLQPVSPFQIVQELSGKYYALAQDHQLSYEPQVGKDCPMALFNPDRLEQVLIILLDNAMKYTPEGGRVGINARWNEEQIFLTVWDTGVGIDPKDQPYVFDRFYKVDKSHSGLGSGLGLSIAKELMDMMGETISLKSHPGQGSQFTITLRRA